MGLGGAEQARRLLRVAHRLSQGGEPGQAPGRAVPVADGPEAPQGRGELGPGTGPVAGFRQMAVAMESAGYRPGAFWAIVAALVMLVAGPLLAVGWHTRAAAAFVCVFLVLGALDKARTHGYFCNRNGLEFPLLWSICALFFVAHGGGRWSVDDWLATRAQRAE